MYSTRKTPKKKPIKKIIRRRKKKPKKPKTISKDIKQSVKQAVQVIVEAPKPKPRPKGLQPKATSIRDNITRPPLFQIIREERNNNNDMQIASLISTLQQQQERQLVPPEPIPNINDNRLEILEQRQQAQLIQQTELMRRQEQQVREQQQRDLDLQIQQVRQQQQILDQQQNERPRLTPPSEVLNLLNRVEQAREQQQRDLDLQNQRQQEQRQQEEEKDEFYDVEEDLPTAQPVVGQIDPQTEDFYRELLLLANQQLEKEQLIKNIHDEKKKLDPYKKDEFKQELDEKQAEEKSPTPIEPVQAEGEPVNIKFKMNQSAINMKGEKTATFQDKVEFLKKNDLFKIAGQRPLKIPTGENQIKISKIFKDLGIDENTGNFISGEVV